MMNVRLGGPEGTVIVMSQNRRDFIKSSAALTLLTVTSASAQPVARTIGVFHTTQISPDEWACFKAGLGAQNWTPKKEGEAKGKYGGSVGNSELAKYINENVDVFVAAGGVTSQLFASNNLTGGQTPPFVYMSGLPADPPSASNGKYCGVILNVPALYPDAITDFQTMGINSRDIYLIQNYNAAMTRGELKDWAYKSFRFFESSGLIDNPDHSNSAAVRAAFNKEWLRFLSLYPRPGGLIINPDPYFRLTAHDFKTALRETVGNIPVVCYPFSDYGPSPPDFLLRNGVTLSSSNTGDANNAYHVLGARVAALLNSSPGTRVASMTWNGARGWAPA